MTEPIALAQIFTDEALTALRADQPTWPDGEAVPDRVHVTIWTSDGVEVQAIWQQGELAWTEAWSLTERRRTGTS